MKYVKFFESFDSSKYYTQIDEERFGDLLGDDWSNEMKFDSKIAKKLSDMGWRCSNFPHQIYDPRSEYNSLFITYKILLKQGLPKGKRLLESFKDARIYQLPDDYFILELSPRWPQIAFLCDQFEGLIKCLEDYNIPKEN